MAAGSPHLDDSPIVKRSNSGTPLWGAMVCSKYVNLPASIVRLGEDEILTCCRARYHRLAPAR